MILYTSVLPDGPAARGAATSWRYTLSWRVIRMGPRVARLGCLFCGDVVAGLRPVGDEAVDDDVANAVGGVERRQVGAVLADLGLGETFGGGDTDALLVEVRRGPEDEDA